MTELLTAAQMRAIEKAAIDAGDVTGLALMERAGSIVSREDLMREVWHTTFWTSSKTIDVHLGWLRRKLGDDSASPRHVITVRGSGYRLATI